MADFKAYEKELAAAGYTFDGRDVRDSLGASVAGVAAYGQVWFKSDEVEAIVSKPVAKPAAQRKAKPKKEVEELEIVPAVDAAGKPVADDPSTPDVNEAWVVKTVKKAVRKK